MTGYIYLITNTVNGKRYVGQTTHCAKKRIRRHFNGQGSKLVYRAVKKYGKDKFRTEIIEVLVEHLDRVERNYIQVFDSLVPNGYNLESGGNENKKASAETLQNMSDAQKGKKASYEAKRKMSEAHKGDKNAFYGKTHTLEVREKISQTHKGKTLSEEHKRKIGASQKGKTLSEEQKRNISKGKKGKKRSPFSAEHRSNMSKAQKNRYAHTKRVSNPNQLTFL